MDRIGSLARMLKPLGIAAIVGPAVLVLVSGFGCAELQRGRATDAPSVGLGLVGRADPYLAHHDPASPTPSATAPPAGVDAPAAESRTGPTVARSTAHPIVPAIEIAEPVVGLAPPVALPVAQAVPGLGPTDETSPDLGRAGKDLIARSRSKLAAIASYRVNLIRQERVGDVLQPEEDVVMSIRREPKAVRVEWPAGPHKGREVIYAADDPSGLLHVNLADAIVPAKLNIPPTSPMVMRSSRHPITEAGFDVILDDLGRRLDATGEAAGVVAYDGVRRVDEAGGPCHVFTRTDRDGETWVVCLDETSLLPVFVKGITAKGDLLERDRFKATVIDPPELALADAFDPARRWGSSGPLGMFSRLARKPAADPGSTPGTARR